MVETKKQPKSKPTATATPKKAPSPKKKLMAGGEYATFGPIMNTGGLINTDHNPMTTSTTSAGTFLNLPTPFSAGNTASADAFAGLPATSIQAAVLPTLGGGAKKAAAAKPKPKAKATKPTKKGCGCK